MRSLSFSQGLHLPFTNIRYPPPPLELIGRVFLSPDPGYPGVPTRHALSLVGRRQTCFMHDNLLIICNNLIIFSYFSQRHWYPNRSGHSNIRKFLPVPTSPPLSLLAYVEQRNAGKLVWVKCGYLSPLPFFHVCSHVTLFLLSYFYWNMTFFVTLQKPKWDPD